MGIHGPEEESHFSGPTEKGPRSPPTRFMFPWYLRVNELKLT